MARQPENLRSGQSFTSADYGPPAVWHEYRIPHPVFGELPGKVFLGQTLGLTGMEVSLGVMPAGAAVPCTHSHKQNEELYFFLSGEGEFQVDGQIFPVRAGSMVRVAPAGERCWRSTGDTPLVHVVIQAKAGSLEQHTAADGVMQTKPVSW